MRRALPITFLVLAILLAGATYFLTTTRFVGRDLLSNLPEPNVFEGPDLLHGYVLARSLRTPASFIDAPDGRVAVPPEGTDPESHAIARLALADPYILGEVVNFRTGSSAGFFLLNASTSETLYFRTEPEWNQRVRELLGADPPPLVPAETFTGP